MERAMAEPLAVWHAEHVNFARLLDLLETQVAAFHRGERPNYDLMGDIVYYLRMDEMQDIIGRLFAAVRTIQNPAHREEVVASLTSLQTETLDGKRVFLYWPNLLISDLPES